MRTIAAVTPADGLRELHAHRPDLIILDVMLPGMSGFDRCRTIRRSPLTRMKVALEFVPPGTARESLREDLVEMEQLVTAILESARLARAGEEIRRQRFDLAAVLCRVTVRDNGPGIPPADLPRISDPFYRVDPSRSRGTGGYGLGLSICTSIIAAHGGSIAVESTVGAGTTVTVVVSSVTRGNLVPGVSQT